MISVLSGISDGQVGPFSLGPEQVAQVKGPLKYIYVTLMSLISIWPSAMATHNEGKKLP
jgi:hypothetical protein